MINSIGYNFNTYPNFRAENIPISEAPLAKPIVNVQKTVENTVDTFVQKVDEEKEKKSNKKAIAVGSSILVLSTLVALLNPKNSSKLMAKMNKWKTQATGNFEKNKNNYLKSKFHKASAKFLDGTIRALNFSNNINAAKDICFKWLCCEKKSFSRVKQPWFKDILQKMDSGFRKVMTPTHKAITNWFDNISQATVKYKYRKALKRMKNFESMVVQYKDKLPIQERIKLQAKLDEIAKYYEYLSEKNVVARLNSQEALMTNLEQDFLSYYNKYRKGFKNHFVDKKEHIDKNLSFWAEEILRPARDELEKNGAKNIEKLIGNPKEHIGLYDDVINILKPHLKAEDIGNFEKSLKGICKQLRSANKSECVEYFDKKRDLILGGAPTDILTAVAGLGLSGTAIAIADSKEEKLSRTVTGAFPVVAGLGASMAFTALLFSGVQGIVFGSLTGIGLSKIGSLVDHHILKTDEKLLAKKNAQAKEVMNV